MGKGRAPCCDKTIVKRGPWSPDEDMKLISFIYKHGHENWRSLPNQAGLLRCGKSCRLRWINYLRPDVKRGNFTAEEEQTIIKLHQSFGNKWSKIASHLHGDESTSSCSSDYLSHEKSDSGKEAKPEVERSEGSLTEKITSPESSPNEFSSMSSGGSNILDPEDVPMGALFDYIESNGETTGMLQEVDKPELLVIPFDSDPNIWSLLDGLDASTHDNSLAPTSGEGDEDEVKKWFKYLENELLEENENNQHKPQAQEEEKSLVKTYELMID